MDELVTLHKLSKVFNGGASHTALAEVSLSISRGELTAVMGPSGSGKSTLLNLIAGLDRPTTGVIHVNGLEVNRLGEAALARYRRDQLGFIFQFFHLLNNLTVLENVLLPAQLAGVRAREAGKRAEELLALLSIAEKAGAFPARLSGGQRQRVAIARALINRPALLLADEPTGALDSRGGEQVMDMLHTINREGQTILLVTHDAKVAARYADRVITLRDGTVVDDARLAPAQEPAARDLLRIRAMEVGQ